jgi:hypothetical protein
MSVMVVSAACAENAIAIERAAASALTTPLLRVHFMIIAPQIGNLFWLLACYLYLPNNVPLVADID